MSDKEEVNSCKGHGIYEHSLSDPVLRAPAKEAAAVASAESKRDDRERRCA